jgi:dTDP-4-dehydrorhamnose reductase
VTRVLVLGSTGMIGSATTRYLTEKGVDVVEVNRSGIAIIKKNNVIKFDCLLDPIEFLFNGIDKNFIIINCIGLIKHLLRNNVFDNISKSIQINSLFPISLISHASMRGIRVIQPATDCVFKGNKGSYSESADKDATDLYGFSKSVGEVRNEYLTNVRVSAIGNEITKHIELLDWLITQDKDISVPGYTNQYWNGVTSLQLAKVFYFLILSDKIGPGTYHLVPSNILSKYEILKIIANKWNRRDLVIKPVVLAQSINRSLKTDFPNSNITLWQGAGYTEIPTIEFMIDEYYTWITSSSSQRDANA